MTITRLYHFGWPVTEEIREKDLKLFKVRLLTMLEEVDEILGSPKPKADPSYVQNSTFHVGDLDPDETYRMTVQSHPGRTGHERPHFHERRDEFNVEVAVEF